MDPIDRIFNSWAALASHFIGECFDLAKPLIDATFQGLAPQVRFVSAQLYIDCHLSSESVLILIREGKEWDADLLLRSVMEGTLKFTYMLQGEPASIDAKVREYWELLPEFMAVRRSERAKRLLEDIGTEESPRWRGIRDVVIGDDEIMAIRQRTTRQERQALEERWSFSGICRAFLRHDDPGVRLLAHLAYGYGNSSNLLHKDGDGVGMVWERSTRNAEQRVALKLGHAARIVSDVCTFAKLRLFSLLRACGQQAGEIRRLEEKYAHQLFDELARAERRFNVTEYGEQA